MLVAETSCARCNPDMGNFGTTIKRLREAAGLTQDELVAKARAAGIRISRSTFQKAEKSAVPPTKVRQYRGVAAALGLTPEQLEAEWKAEAGFQVTLWNDRGEIIELPREMLEAIERNAKLEGKEPADYFMQWIREHFPQVKDDVHPEAMRQLDQADPPPINHRAVEPDPPDTTSTRQKRGGKWTAGPNINSVS